VGADDGEDLAEKRGAAAGESRDVATLLMHHLPAMTLQDGAGRKILLWNEYSTPLSFWQNEDSRRDDRGMKVG